MKDIKLEKGYYLLYKVGNWKVVYGDDEWTIEGYDGEENIELTLFDTENEREQFIEDFSVRAGESEGTETFVIKSKFEVF